MSPAENPLMSLTWAVWLSSHSEGQAGGTCEVEGGGGQSKCEEECGTCMNPAMVEKTYSTKERRGMTSWHLHLCVKTLNLTSPAAHLSIRNIQNRMTL